MARITKQNYENFALDFLEGRLSALQAKEFELFLAQNPEIKAELEGIGALRLLPPKVSFSGKEQLKKAELHEAPDLNDFDNLCVARLEGDLSPAQQAEFDHFLEKNPLRAKEYQIFEQTRLSPNYEIEFPAKAKIRKMHVVHKKPLVVWSAISAAAAILLFFVLVNSLSLPLRGKMAAWAVQENKRGMKISFNHAQNAFYQARPEKKQSAPKQSASNQKTQKPENFEKNLKANAEAPLENSLSFQIEPVSILALDNLPNKPDLFFVPVKKPAKPAIAEASEEEFMPVKEFLAQEVRKKIAPEKTKEQKLHFWDIAGAAVNGLGKLTKRKLMLKSRYDENGKVKELEFVAGNFGIARKRSK